MTKKLRAEIEARRQGLPVEDLQAHPLGTLAVATHLANTPEVELAQARVELDVLRATLAKAEEIVWRAMIISRLWKAGAKEMWRDKQAAKRKARLITKHANTIVPTNFEARERAKIASGVYEVERLDTEADQEDVEEPVNTVPKKRTAPPVHPNPARRSHKKKPTP